MIKSRLERISIIIAIVVGLGGLATGAVSLVIANASYNLSKEGAAELDKQARKLEDEAATLYANKALVSSYRGRVYVQNYGNLPIIAVEAVAQHVGIPMTERDSNEVVLRLGTVPPCSQVDITDWFVQAATTIQPATAGVVIRFNDINNIRWERSGGGAPTRIGVGEYVYSTDNKSLATEALPKCA